jgi:hypothetical protein
VNRLRSKSHLVVAVAVGLGWACASTKTINKDEFRELMTPIVKRQAAFDLQCGEDQVQVVQIADVSFGATGCGRRASYIPEKTSCSPGQYASLAKDVCGTVIANVASKNP